MKKCYEFTALDCTTGIVDNLETIEFGFYELCFYLTFKKALKSHQEDFSNARTDRISDLHFFEDIDDVFVRQISSTMLIVNNLHTSMHCVGYIDEGFYLRHSKFLPKRFFTYRKSYSMLLNYYGFYLDGTMRMLYFYAAALSVESYQLPKTMRIMPDCDDVSWSKSLNQHDSDVMKIIQAIENLNMLQKLFKQLMKLR